MEEDRGLGNIIFYIIAAIIAIISSIKGKKKPVPGSPEGGPARGGGGSGFPDDMFDEDEDEAFPFPPEYDQRRYQPGPVVAESRPAAATMSSGTEGAYEEPMAAAFSGEGVSALNYIETARRFEELLKETSTAGFNWSIENEEDAVTDEIHLDTITSDFDGRQAVIYSEILARREY